MSKQMDSKCVYNTMNNYCIHFNRYCNLIDGHQQYCKGYKHSEGGDTNEPIYII